MRIGYEEKRGVMTNNYIDLHIHSLYSDDGEFTPLQLVEQCRQIGLRMMAITDHNCVKANLEAQRVSEKAGIKYIPGVELDCTYQGVDLHVLGYGIDFFDCAFTQIEENVTGQNQEASQKRLLLINQLGFHVTEEELESLDSGGSRSKIWTGEKFAEVLLSKEEYSDHELLKPYRPGGVRSDNPFVNFYWDFCAQGKPCYVKVSYPDLKEAIKAIHDTGGQAVLAHPGINLSHNYSLFEEMVWLGLDGVEVGSSYHPRETASFFYQQSIAHKLLITGGSDYHGKTKPAIRLGKYERLIQDKEMEVQLSL
jgi:hypothetical protein